MRSNQVQTTPPSASARALRRLIIILLFTLSFVIFAYGWSVTKIDLRVPQEPQRQNNVGNALRELLSPNVFTQDYIIQNTTTTFRILCSDDFTPPTPAVTDGPYIVVEPHCAANGSEVVVRGYNFYQDSLARINWLADDGERRIRRVAGATGDNFITRPDGTFEVAIEVPRIRGSNNQIHTIEAQGRFPEGLPRISDATHLVLEKMLETIFLALIATAVSILPAGVLSFFAAHNLMRPIRVPLGNLLVSWTLLPVGWLLGTALIAPLGMLALKAGTGDLLFSSAAAGFIIASTTYGSFKRTPSRKTGPLWRQILMSALVPVVFVMGLGLVGGIGIFIQKITAGTDIAFIGNFIGSLGQIIELLMVPVAGLAGAMTLSSLGLTLSRDGLKYASPALAHGLGLVLGALAGAILMGLIALIAMGAAWLGLLLPVILASLTSPILPLVYRRFVPKPIEPSNQDQALMTALSWTGSLIGAGLAFWQLNVMRALVEGTLPGTLVAFQAGDFVVYRYVLQAMILGAVVGGIACGLAGTQAAFPMGNMLYNVTRTILNALRSIEPLIMGLIFVIWVGIGPFAGVLALALHSIASLGKLYSEQIESIDEGPIEALLSTGANRLQTIMYAVVPQIIPPYIAFTMYRWDINVRMSTIIGFVGGGGIGFLLQQQINLLRYRDAGVAVLAIAIVVSILDYASAAIRERYT